MEVMLLQDVKGVGRKFEVKDVSDGFARNFLIGKGLARQANAQTVKEARKMVAQKVEAATHKIEQRVEIAHEIDGKSVTLGAKPNKQGGLFASIPLDKVVKAVKAQLGMTIDEDLIRAEGPIKQLGTHRLKYVPTEDTTATFEVIIEKQ